MEKTHQNYRSIEKELFINVTSERVFQALTQKAELERWFVKTAELDLRPGGLLKFDWGPGIFQTGKILVLEPPHRLSYTWEALSPSPTTVTFALTAENAGTYLHLSHTNIGEGEDWEHYYTTRNKGWSIHLSNLIAWLETGKEKTR